VITATLCHPGDRDGFHRQLDSMLTAGVGWDEVTWVCGADTTIAPPRSRHRMRHGLSESFLDLCDTVLLHHDEDRFVRLHRMAQRVHEDRRHWDDVLHPEHRHLLAYARHVRRDMHKMKAFVRFTRVGADDENTHERYIAWFEPEHHIVQAMAPFFARRFANMRWAILTPLGSLNWDGVLEYGPAASRSAAPPADGGEALWLTYYANIFNPARVKQQAMRREMPVKYWKNLPEAALIPELIAEAPRRSREMVARQECGTRQGSRPGSAQSSATDALSALRHQVQRCDQCECAAHATQAVFGEGRVGARVMVVGEQPGDREDLEGRPFVGPAGELLRAALLAAGTDPADVYITNAVKHFRYEMRGKRRIHKTPLQQDILACVHWLQREYEVIAPRQVLLLGRTAMTAATQCWGAPPASGDWFTAQGIPIFVAAHPAALLRAGETMGSAGYLRWQTQIHSYLQF
jgi:probable DNA metabolism protein